MLGTLLLACTLLQDPPPAPVKTTIQVRHRPEETAQKPTAKPESKDKPGVPPTGASGDEGKSERAVQPGAPESSIIGPVRNLVIPRPNALHSTLPSYVVRLRMLGGRRFSGIVVRDPAFHESVHEGKHHSEEIYQTDIPFTLSYVDGLDGQVTLRWNQVEKVEIKAVLDLAGLRAVEDEMFQARVARHAELEKRLQEDAAAAAAAADATEAPVAGETPPVPEAEHTEVPAEPSLLIQFPPEDDWTPERKKHLEWRRTVMGVFPDESEQRFLDVYDQWLPLYEEWVAEQERVKAEQDKAEAAAKAALEAARKKVLPPKQ